MSKLTEKGLGRRSVLVAMAAAAGAWWLRPGDTGGPYSDYFGQLNQLLQDSGIGHPRMVLDLDAIDSNVDAIRADIPAPKQWRVVVKSLPSLPLLQYLMARGNTRSLMVFHQPFLNQVAEQVPDADLLLGKPLPVASAARFYQQLVPGEFDPASQLQWLIDTPQRLNEYHQLAREQGLQLKLNLELDVGLHRGGFSSEQGVVQALAQIAADPQHLSLGGFMGYEAFLAKLPGMERNVEKVKQLYRQLVGAGRGEFPQLFEQPLTYNIAGSQTYAFYSDDEFFNDISVGSGVVMPTDFDLPTLARHRPAAYIATPVLKHYDEVLVPGIEAASPLFAALDPNRQQAFYTYGGNWLADYENPPGLKNNPVWGYSSNQEMVNASDSVPLAVGDFIFLRPRQSEAVFLQFGDLLTYRGTSLQGEWPILTGV
jgi:D-serine deaminase-like pyridoxal phosphate-dependent protein